MPGTVAEGPSVSMSFANNFWGKEDAGVVPLLERMHNAKQSCDELKAFYSARAAIEEEYSRKLLSLCRKPLGSQETGTLRSSLDVVRGEVESMAKAHSTIAGQMKSELEEPLAAFAGGMKERRKIVQNGIEKLLKTKIQQTQAVNKSRDRYEQDCLRIKGYLAQGHMVMGQEERKNKAKLEKTQIQLASNSTEYESAIKVLEETTGRWNKEWKAACDKFQDLEEERLDFTKSSLWNFANIASTVCVSDDASCEKMRLSLEKCEVEKDINDFIQGRGTGQEIPDPPKYINFCRGDLNDTASENSDDEGYSVAQFPRTINPAFRSSSPQPSLYDSHHDAESDLAKSHGHGDFATPRARETTVTPQSSSNQPTPLETPRSNQVPPGYDASQYGDIPTVPHNDYPTEGMTMFCRTGPPSERSSAVSAARPSSRDSQSEYSNPTSFSSQEPASGHQSPTKPTNGVPLAGMSADKSIQKKRSGFFSNSPFSRRKSKHEIQHPQVTPTARNTWAPSHSSSPTKSHGRSPFGRDRPSDSPEPVDPRANFQLNVGNNVFDVASPDGSRKTPGANDKSDDTDPIARALADLKGLGKQASTRVSADRYHGISTPAPGGPPPPLSKSPINASHRGTPPPAYDPAAATRRLDAPQPAFTSAQMQRTTQKYTAQTQDMFSSQNGSQPGTRGSGQGYGDVPRAASPNPMRATSPRPGFAADGRRGSSPAPYQQKPGRQAQSPSGHPSNRGSGGPQAYGQYSRHGSPNDMAMQRVASPQPQYARQDSQRPNSAGMELQLSGNQVDSFGGRPRGGSNARPQSMYHGPDAGRQRSRTMTGGSAGPVSRDGRPVMHFARAMYAYTAAIPEELTFAKGDVLAVLRHQDDGWWEAEVTSKRGLPGLVPSNYLQKC